MEAIATSFISQSTGYLPPTYGVMIGSATSPAPEAPVVVDATSSAGDPARIAELAGTFDRLYADAMGKPLRLRGPASEEQIATVEKAFFRSAR